MRCRRKFLPPRRQGQIRPRLDIIFQERKRGPRIVSIMTERRQGKSISPKSERAVRPLTTTSVRAVHQYKPSAGTTKDRREKRESDPRHTYFQDKDCYYRAATGRLQARYNGVRGGMEEGRRLRGVGQLTDAF
jgi:hypothetical protein